MAQPGHIDAGVNRPEMSSTGSPNESTQHITFIVEVVRAELPRTHGHDVCVPSCTSIVGRVMDKYYVLIIVEDAGSQSTHRTSIRAGSTPEWRQPFLLTTAPIANITFSVFAKRWLLKDRLIGAVTGGLHSFAGGYHVCDLGNGDGLGSLVINVLRAGSQRVWPSASEEICALSERVAQNPRNVAREGNIVWLPRLLGILSDVVAATDKVDQVHPYAAMALEIFTWMDKSSSNFLERDASHPVQKLVVIIINLLSTASTDSSGKSFALESILRQTVECAFFIRAYASYSSLMLTNTKIEDGHWRDRFEAYDEACGRLLESVLTGTEKPIAVTRVLYPRFSEEQVKSAQGVLMRLPYVTGASLCPQDSYAGATLGARPREICLPGTRLGLLAKLTSWVASNDDDISRVLVLIGVAGSGKSTVASTIAYRFARLHRLGASFAFDRSNLSTHPRALFPTIARDLAHFDPDICTAIGHVIGAYGSFPLNSDLAAQFELLLVKPFRSLEVVGPILLVIDGLDECASRRDSEQWIHRQRLLSILLHHTSQLPESIRILITSRPEADIVGQLGSAHVETVHMDEAGPDAGMSDIEDYIHSRLSSAVPDISQAFTREESRKMATLSEGLFIWAEVACNFITESSQPTTIRGRYEALVHSKAEPMNGLDELYGEVLSRQLSEKADPELFISRYRTAMSVVLATYQPCSLATLNAFLRADGHAFDAEEVLGSLSVLLSGVSNTPMELITPLHTSFREYSIDSQRSSGFFVELAEGHRILAVSCQSLMVRELKFNICDLESSYLPNQEILDLRERIASHITPHLAYSVAFWLRHLRRCRDCPFDESHINDVRSLLKDKFLFWLEVLSIIDSPIEDAVQDLWRLSQFESLAAVYLDSENTVNLASFIDDATRFVQAFKGPIELSAPHIYLSALPFTVGTTIYQLYGSRFPETFSVRSLPTGLRRSIVQHSGAVLSVAPFPTDDMVVSTSQDGTVCRWSSRTGALHVRLETPHIHGEIYPAESVAVSQNGELIALLCHHKIFLYSSQMDCPPLLTLNAFGSFQIVFLHANVNVLVSCASVGVTAWEIPSTEPSDIQPKRISEAVNQEEGEHYTLWYDGITSSGTVLIAHHRNTETTTAWNVTSGDDHEVIWRQVPTHGAQTTDVLHGRRSDSVKMAQERLLAATQLRCAVGESACGEDAIFQEVSTAVSSVVDPFESAVRERSWAISTATSPDGSLVAYAFVSPSPAQVSGEVRVRETDTGRIVWSVSVGPTSVTAVEFASKSRQIVVGTRIGRVHVLDIDWLFGENRTPPPGPSLFGSQIDPLHAEETLPRGGLCMLENGWVIAPTAYDDALSVSETGGKLLFWVPPEYRETLHLPPYRNTVIGNEGGELTELDFAHFLHGSKWSHCYMPGPVSRKEEVAVDVLTGA